MALEAGNTGSVVRVSIGGANLGEVDVGHLTGCGGRRQGRRRWRQGDTVSVDRVNTGEASLGGADVGD